jgi:hypothetical protein
MEHSIKLKALAILPGCHAAASSSATVVSYSLGGTVNYLQTPTNALPAKCAATVLALQ